MQACPPLNCLAEARSAATFFTSASASTMTGDLPPSSSVTLARCLAAAAITTLPTRVLPVKKMWLNGSSSRAVATFTSPSNSATSFSSKASPDDLAGDACGGRAQVREFHHAAVASGYRGRQGARAPDPSGKFQGPRIRHTPRASWTILAVSFLLSEVCTSTGFIHSSRLCDVPVDVAEHVQDLGDTDLAARACACPAFTAATMSSACASTAAFSFSSLSLRCPAVVAFISHWWARCRAKTCSMVDTVLFSMRSGVRR